MPASALQKCGDDEERHLRRLATYRKHIDNHCQKGRERMAKLRSVQTEAQQEKHREAQRCYRERFREQIAHCVHCTNTKRNAEGKATVPRPKARQYWSDPEQYSEEEEEEEQD
ncbi:hypothetical protein DFH08DRAFT_804561 [Mycena albidolilacea]|uniref:Uncharacterized protein n=1 Tax=Mycena albidolilacea TaxID=1033008 RepID=A0AAD7EXQ2_9AGAR|nr:hypothetical protein DFH08DRAFT_804561 [Mycena albidolilacea]